MGSHLLPEDPDIEPLAAEVERRDTVWLRAQGTYHLANAIQRIEHRGAATRSAVRIKKGDLVKVVGGVWPDLVGRRAIVGAVYEPGATDSRRRLALWPEHLPNTSVMCDMTDVCLVRTTRVRP